MIKIIVYKISNMVNSIHKLKLSRAKKQLPSRLLKVLEARFNLIQNIVINVLTYRKLPEESLQEI